eukprot:jgi/Botrbrau1/16912/Bobra.0374s0002.1
MHCRGFVSQTSTHPLRATDTGSTGAPSLAATKKQVRLSQTQIKYAIASFNL